MSYIELKGLKALRCLADENNPKKNAINFISLPIDKLEVGHYQPRQKIDNKELAELAASIRLHGVLQPLIVRQNKDKYEIIAGERRWRAAKTVGCKFVPVIIRAIEDKIALAFSLIENIQREKLTAIEEAFAFNKFQQEFQMTHADVAHLLGRSRVSVTNTIRLLRLADDVKRYLQLGDLEMGHARALLTLTHDTQKLLAKKIIAEKLTVREAELLVQQEKSSQIKKHPHYNEMRKWATILEKKFSAKVRLNVGRLGKSRLSMQFNSPIDLERLVNLISQSKEEKK